MSARIHANTTDAAPSCEAQRRATAGESATAVLAQRYRAIRAQTERLCEPLATEDFVVQTTPDVSPTKWHLAHTTWFYETFILTPNVPGYRAFDPQYERLFNSYYNAVGPQHSRPKRGWLSRPTVQDVFAYRRHVDQAMLDLLDQRSAPSTQLDLIELGLQHEQQHQELILTDIKHVLASNALRAVYGGKRIETSAPPPLQWIKREEALDEIGIARDPARAIAPEFAFDNESPRHRVFIEEFEIASRLVTCGEYLDFIRDRGYERPELWLSDGWRIVQSEQWRAPLYWENDENEWSVVTLAGRRAVDPNEPVTHVSFYEADAYARWAGARLLTEAEWEVVARDCPIEGNFLESGFFHPTPAGAGHEASSASHLVPGACSQIFGDCWEWTASPYAPYPRYAPLPGALGEYNAKFMCNQMVLRGGSCATPRLHIRATYRNFFPPEARWQFTGIRLGRDPV